MRGVKLISDLVDAKTGKVMAEAGTKMTPRLAQEAAGGRASRNRCVPHEELVGRYVADDLINEETGEIYSRPATSSPQAIVEQLDEAEHHRASPTLASTTSTSAPISATRWRSTRTRTARKR